MMAVKDKENSGKKFGKASKTALQNLNFDTSKLSRMIIERQIEKRLEEMGIRGKRLESAPIWGG